MKDLLSPKQVAASIGVSESSLKRWCDQGVLATERTPGGHRRIRAAEVVRFLRERDHTLVRPELLGLPVGLSGSPRSIDRSASELLAALEAGDASVCERVVVDAFVSGVALVRLCEEVVAPAMHAIGAGWECGDLEVFQEHRASELVNRSLYTIRTLLPPAEPGAAVAVGGTPPGDHYRLATLMVELVLLEAGWNAMSLGSALPFATMTAAAERHRPQLFWLSFSHVACWESLREDFDGFIDSLPSETRVVVGGQLAEDGLAANRERVDHCRSLSELQRVVGAIPPTP